MCKLLLTCSTIKLKIYQRQKVEKMDIPLPIVTLTILTIVGVSAYYYWDRVQKPKKAKENAERRARREARRKTRNENAT